MNYEEKYKKALEKAKIYRNHLIETGDDTNEIEYIFPEIVEIENEKIREEILSVIKQFDKNTTICGKNYDYNKWIDWLEKQGEQKSSWSEEDEYQINTILYGLYLKKELYKKEGNKVEEDRYNTQYNWLKSIKGRVQPQQKQEWSEEDEKIIETMCKEGDLKPSEMEWLRSLKPNNWKPSEYDISLLEEIARNIRNNIRPFCSEVSSLEALIDTLKNL